MTRIYGLETHQVLQSGGVPILIPSSGTMGANGALSAITAISDTYPDMYLYFPAGAVYVASAAGFYYAVMSSTTAGTVYNNVYTPGTNLPNIPASPTPITAAAPGAYTQVLASIIVISVQVDGGSMGKNGVVRMDLDVMHSNSAAQKILKTNFGGTQQIYWGGATAVRILTRHAVINRGRVDKQAYSLYIDGTSSSYLPLVNSIDTSNNQVFTIALQLTAATDYVGVNYYFSELLPKN